MPRVEVVGTVADGHAAIDLATDLQPDVVVIDIRVPGLDGVGATRRITTEQPHIAVIALTMAEGDATLFVAMRAAALGYLLKGTNQAQIVAAIMLAAQGETVFGPTIARRMTDFFAAQPATVSLAFPQLTAREREILKPLTEGLASAQIAQRLALSPKTVRNNVANIFAKLHLTDRTEAIMRARDAGIGP